MKTRYLKMAFLLLLCGSGTITRAESPVKIALGAHLEQGPVVIDRGKVEITQPSADTLVLTMSGVPSAPSGDYAPMLSFDAGRSLVITMPKKLKKANLTVDIHLLESSTGDCPRISVGIARENAAALPASPTKAELSRWLDEIEKSTLRVYAYPERPKPEPTLSPRRQSRPTEFSVVAGEYTLGAVAEYAEVWTPATPFDAPNLRGAFPPRRPVRFQVTLKVSPE
jgi:hypothetical protein